MGLIKVTPADKWFSKCVRERADWRCERCGAHHLPNSQGLHCAHWHSRGNWGTRFDKSNAAALCYGCHVVTGREREREHKPLMLRLVGDLELDRLWHDSRRPAHGIRKRVPEISKHYRDQYEAMLAERTAGRIGRLEFDGWTP